MADGVEIERPGGRTWTVSADLLVLHFASAGPVENRETVAEGRHDGFNDFVQRGEDGARQESDSSTKNPDCADVVHSPKEVQS